MIHYALLIIASLLPHNVLSEHSITPALKHNLSIYPWEDEDWPNEPYGDFLHRCMRYQSTMQPFKKYKTTWNILERQWNHTTHYDSIVYNDPLTWQNVQLLRSENEDDLSNC